SPPSPSSPLPTPSHLPPDGGWGWVILVGCFVITGFSYAFPKAVSVYFKELMKEFHVGYSDTAWISSIILAMLYGSGPLCSIMVNRFGCRPVMLFGGLLASTGMILASFCTSITQIYLSAGMVTGGLGLALNFQPSLIMLGRYFEKRRPLANGLAAAGSPVFLSTLSLLGQVLLDKYGWRGGFLITGGLLLNCCTCGAVMRPLENSKELEENLSRNTAGKEEEKKLLDFSVFRDRNFIIYTVSKFILVLGLFVPPIMIVNYAKDIGVPDTEAAFLLSIIGFIDIFARPSSGMVAGLEWMRPRVSYLFSISMLFNGLTDVLSAKASSYTGLVIFCVFFGISYGMVGALQFEVLMAIVGSNKFPSAIGLVLLVESVAVLIGPPSLIFYMAGSELILSSVFLALASYFCLGRPKSPSEKRKHDPELEAGETGEGEREGEAGAGAGEVGEAAGADGGEALGKGATEAGASDGHCLGNAREDGERDGGERQKNTENP
uniref:Solute carrier family 16 member 8 n=1 Tax=Callorhinchus milii TaxID=7868 RepID=A0A4W3H3T1_CALMI